MMTWLTERSFANTAACLDMRRLGSQRGEARQILKALTGESRGYLNHPVTKAWRGFEEGLAVYGLYICSEWRSRGYRDSQFEWFQQKRLELRRYRHRYTKFPDWVNDPRVHEAMRERLMWKDPDHYCTIWPDVFEPFDEPEFPWELMAS